MMPLMRLSTRVLAAAREDAQALGRAQTKTANAEIAAKATVLAAHPSFNFSRVSFEKRLTLAEARSRSVTNRSCVK